MGHDLLLEIGLEEIPAHIVIPSQEQLAERVQTFLQENRLSFGEVESFSTPRRLAVLIHSLVEKQNDEKKLVKGPAKHIALSEDGTWSKAAKGFVKGQGLTTEDIYFKEIKGVEYVYVEKFIPGKMTMEIVQHLDKVVTAMTFPVSMHWADYALRYIRPIHWITALLDETIIPFTVLDIKTGRESRGHRFIGKEISISTASNYEKDLKGEYVIANAKKREQSIVSQIQKLADDNEWVVDFDGDLLEEVTNLVEYPTAFYGAFDKKYLTIPEEVLITSMRDHQRYFYVKDRKNKLLPYFISVRNGNKNFIENVARGNEKVLVARLDDAMFFYEEDKKLTIANCVERLKNVSFHEKTGSMFEKMQRVQKISQYIGKLANLKENEMSDLSRAAGIYKFDLVTNMVDEFPELQGIMGEKYSLIKGENKAVAQAIREHYLPTSSEGKLPESKVGTVLSIADKLDSIFNLYAAGVIPTGSNDPFALRRQAFGIIRMTLNKNIHLELETTINQMVSLLPKTNSLLVERYKERKEDVISFIKGRIRQLLSLKKTSHDIIEAVLDSKQQNSLTIIDTADTLTAHHNEESFKSTIESVARVMNLAAKVEKIEEWQQKEIINRDLFETNSEKLLYKSYTKLKTQFNRMTTEEQYQALVELHPIIDTFFDENMVMSNNKAVRQNRLTLLVNLTELFLTFANIKQLVVK